MDQNKKISYGRREVRGQIGQVSFEFQNLKNSFSYGKDYFQKSVTKNGVYSSEKYFLNKKNSIYNSDESLGILKLEID